MGTGGWNYQSRSFRPIAISPTKRNREWPQDPRCRSQQSNAWSTKRKTLGSWKAPSLSRTNADPPQLRACRWCNPLLLIDRLSRILVCLHVRAPSDLVHAPLYQKLSVAEDLHQPVLIGFTLALGRSHPSTLPLI